jgi:DNA/RNA-binding domain of Phe-tRNA-synthetase-like protein
MTTLRLATVTDEWRSKCAGAHAGFLALRGVSNPDRHPVLERHKAALEQALRERFSGMDRTALVQSPVLKAYADYYRRFRKTYHIQLQLESVVFKGKSLPGVSSLVEAMFMAELSDLLLTAGHDLDVVTPPVTLDVARGDEAYTTLRGGSETLKEGDMFIADQQGVISSIIYGPDQRTQIMPTTRQVLFTTYAPPGVSNDAVAKHLQTLENNVRLIAPSAEVIERQIVGADYPAPSAAGLAA